MNKLKLLISFCLLFWGCGNDECKKDTIQLAVKRDNMSKVNFCTIENRSKGGYYVMYYYDYPTSCKYLYALVIEDQSLPDNYWIKEHYTGLDNRKYSDSQMVTAHYNDYVTILFNKIEIFKSMKLRYLEFHCDWNMILLTTRDTNYFFLEDTTTYFSMFEGGPGPDVTKLDTGLYKFNQYSPPY